MEGLGFQNLELGETGAISASISREKSETRHDGVRSYIKIRQRGGARSAAPAVLQERLAGQESSFPGNGLPLVKRRGQCAIHQGNRRVVDGNLSVNYGLMIRILGWADSLRAFSDHAAHLGSRLITSRKILLSTSTPREPLRRLRKADGTGFIYGTFVNAVHRA